MSSLLLTDTPAQRGRLRVSRGGRRVVVPLAEYRATRAGLVCEPELDLVDEVREVREVHEVAAGEPALRLTRRGRFVVRTLGGAALLLVVAAGALAGRPALAGQDADTPVAEHVVLPGETLWQIAGEVAPGSDRRDTVEQIIDLNDLSSAGVTVGQRLAVPAPTR